MKSNAIGYFPVEITCLCGNSIQTRSTLSKNITVEVCSSCHPSYTGKQKTFDSLQRVALFNKKYSNFKKI